MILVIGGCMAMSRAAALRLSLLCRAIDVVVASDAHIPKFDAGLAIDSIGYPFDFPEPQAEPAVHAIQHGPVRKGKGGKPVRWGGQFPSKHNRRR
jgi:hypothetical protein